MQLIFSTFLITLLIYFLLMLTKERVIVGDVSYPINNRALIIIYAFVLIFVSSFRKGFIDTADYRLIYTAVGRDISNVFNDAIPRVEKGYLLFVYLLNTISGNSQFLLIIVAIIINVIYIKQIYKYSEDVPFSLYLYFVLVYMNTINGMRQMLAGSFFLLTFDWIEKNKTTKIILFIFLLATIHKSILFCIPLYFIIKGRKLNFGIIGLFILALASLVAPNLIIEFFQLFLHESEYTSYLNQIMGMNPIRLFVEIIPSILSCIYLLQLNRNGKGINRKDEIMINITFVNLAILIFAMNILFFARLGMYLQFFNLILIPNLINKVFTQKDRRIVKLCATILYGIYFCYQIFAFSGFGYMRNFYLIFN